jgi:hypothetical protein
VGNLPSPRDLANFARRPKQIYINRLKPQGAVELLDPSILVELAGLDVDDRDLVPLPPLDKACLRHFRTIFASNTLMLAMLQTDVIPFRPGSASVGRMTILLSPNLDCLIELPPSLHDGRKSN